MSTAKSIFIFGLCLLLGCATRDCKGIENGGYKGYGILFYHLPVSGSNYELIFAPVCGDTLALTEKTLADTNDVRILLGVSCVVNLRNSRFSEIVRKSRKMKLLNNETLAPQYRMVYVCPIYVELRNLRNVTQINTSRESNTLKERFIFEDKRQLVLEYFFSDTYVIDNLRAL